MSNKTPLERIYDGDELEAGDIRAAIIELANRVAALEHPKPAAKKAAKHAQTVEVGDV